MQFTLLATVGTLGLNAQQPVTFQSIMDVYFGIILGLTLSALVQRLLWPVLPQWQMRDRVLELLRICGIILESPPDQRPRWLHQRLALIPGEALNWIAVMNKSDCPPDEPQRLREYLQRCAARRDISCRPRGNCFLCCLISRPSRAARRCVRFRR